MSDFSFLHFLKLCNSTMMPGNHSCHQRTGEAMGCCCTALLSNAIKTSKSTVCDMFRACHNNVNYSSYLQATVTASIRACSAATSHILYLLTISLVIFTSVAVAVSLTCKNGFTQKFFLMPTNQFAKCSSTLHFVANKPLFTNFDIRS